MKKLSKSQEEERRKYAAKLRECGESLEAAIEAFNEAMRNARPVIERAVEAYNEAVADAEAFTDDIASDQQSYIEDRSEKWCESDTGSNYTDWKDQWESVGLNEIEVELPDEVDQPDLGHADLLEELASDPGC